MVLHVLVSHEGWVGGLRWVSSHHFLLLLLLSVSVGVSMGGMGPVLHGGEVLHLALLLVASLQECH